MATPRISAAYAPPGPLVAAYVKIRQVRQVPLASAHLRRNPSQSETSARASPRRRPEPVRDVGPRISSARDLVSPIHGGAQPDPTGEFGGPAEIEAYRLHR